MLEAELRSNSARRMDNGTSPMTDELGQLGIHQISRIALSATHAPPTIRNSPCCDMENNKTPPLDSHSQTQKLLAKPRGEATTKHKTKRNKNNKTEPQAWNSRTRYIHSTKPDIIDKAESIHEQNPRQNPIRNQKTQQSRRNLLEQCLGSQNPNISALKRSKSKHCWTSNRWHHPEGERVWVCMCFTTNCLRFVRWARRTSKECEEGGFFYLFALSSVDSIRCWCQRCQDAVKKCPVLHIKGLRFT